MLILIAVACGPKKTDVRTTYGLWTDYILIPSTLKGKVKEVKELNYWALEKDGKITKGELMSKKELDSIGSTNNTILNFDENGNPLRYDHLDRENVISTRFGKTENGHLSGMDYKIGDSTTYYFRIEYDSNGYPIVAKGFRPGVDTLINSAKLFHDTNGFVTKFEYYNAKGLLTGYNTCTPDITGNNTEVKSYNNSDTLRWIWINTFDKDGIMTRQEAKNMNTGQTVVWTYKDFKYDDKGNLISYYGDIDNGKYKVVVERTITYFQ